MVPFYVYSSSDAIETRFLFLTRVRIENKIILRKVAFKATSYRYKVKSQFSTEHRRLLLLLLLSRKSLMKLDKGVLQ